MVGVTDIGSGYPPPAYPPLGVGAMVGAQPLDASSITTLPAIGGAESFPPSGSAASGTWE
jgi:hypothetical protein